MIFTFAPETSVAPDFPDRARQAVEAAGGEIIFVRLTLSRDEQERRIGSPDRAAFGKLRSLDLLKNCRTSSPPSQAATPPLHFTIDTGATKSNCCEPSHCKPVHFHKRVNVAHGWA